MSGKSSTMRARTSQPQDCGGPGLALSTLIPAFRQSCCFNRMGCRVKTNLGSESPTGDQKQKVNCTSDGPIAAEPPVRDAAACESEVNDAAVQESAYFKWQAAGCPCGNDVEFWLEAEAELRHGM